MSHNDEQTPIRERWTARPAGQDDEATAGALLRAAAQHGPVPEKRLAEIHARLRRTRQSRSLARPAPRVLRQLVFAAGFVLCGGVLSASVMHVMRRPPKAPEAAPAPAVESHKKPPRRAPGNRAPAEVVTPSEAPEASVPALAPPVPPVPENLPPAPPSQPEAQVTAPAPRLPRASFKTPDRDLAREEPRPARREEAEYSTYSNDERRSGRGPQPPGRRGVSFETGSNPHRRIAIKEPSPVPVVAPLERPVPSLAVVSPAPSPIHLLAPPEMPSPPLPKTPVERPVSTVLPAPTPVVPALALPAPRPAQSEPSRLARESRWLASAIAKLRQEGAPEQALAILDQHQSELGSGALASEANATRIEALLRLGRNGQALVLLDGQRLSAQGLGREMLVARGELRAEKGRTSSAIHDFDQILSSPGRVDGIIERALYGRATCRAKSGDRDGARGDFEKYLSAFPQGRFTSEARSALSSLVR